MTYYKKEELVKVATNTLEIMKQGQYQKGNQTISIKNELDKAIKDSILYSPQKLDALKIESTNDFNTVIETTGETTIAAAKRLNDEGFTKTISLNFASARKPGGGFLSGATAQEESLSRASGLYPCLTQMKEMYDYNNSRQTALYSDYMIYSPDVPVFKNDNGNLLDQIFTTSFITSAAPNAGAVMEREPQNKKQIDAVMRVRIEKILTVALHHKYEALVLGAFGCGVFKNNPYTVANQFRQLLNDAKFRKQFKKVVFAVYDTTPRKETFNVFKSILR